MDKCFALRKITLLYSDIYWWLSVWERNWDKGAFDQWSRESAPISQAADGLSRVLWWGLWLITVLQDNKVKLILQDRKNRLMFTRFHNVYQDFQAWKDNKTRLVRPVTKMVQNK